MFEDIYNNYTAGNLSNLIRIEAGASTKKLYTTNQYLLIDFENNKECNDFVTTTNLLEDFSIPKVYYSKNNIAITEYIEGSTLHKLIEEGTKHKLIQDTYTKSIDWIIRLQQCTINLHTTVEHNKNISLTEILLLLELVNMKDVYEKQATELVNTIYSNDKVCLCHNDFQIGNIIHDKKNNYIKIVDYQDVGYNIQHYDIVSLLYSIKCYMSDKDRSKMLDYYYDKIKTPNSDYNTFVSNIVKIAFVRLCRSLRWRFYRVCNSTNIDILCDIRRGLKYLKKLEKYVGIEISDRLKSMYLPVNNIVSIVLCAGKGTRMASTIPKCAVELLGKPMIEYVANAVNTVCCCKNFYIVGYKKEIITDILKDSDAIFVEQIEQLGTGHAVQQVVPYLDDGKIVLVIMGDMCIVNFELLRTILISHRTTNATSTLVTNICKTGYQNAKIIRDEFGQFVRIVEFKDIDFMYDSEDAVAIKNIKETNTGLYIFNSTELKQYLLNLDNNNSQKEYYLPDVIKMQQADGLKINAVVIDNLIEPTGANTMEELKQIEQQFCML